jgi:hypothetical protein
MRRRVHQTFILPGPGRLCSRTEGRRRSYLADGVVALGVHLSDDDVAPLEAPYARGERNGF